MNNAFRQLWIASLIVLFPGCRDQKISVYEVPKETREAPMPTPRETATTTNLTWDEPESWQKKPVTAFRKASFSAGQPETGEVDISVSVFPDQAGGLLANVNRWRGQIGLPPISEEGLIDETTPVTMAGTQGVRLDMSGSAGEESDAQRIVAVIASIDGSAWFFKMSGGRKAIEPELEAFDTFIRSVRPAPEPPALSGINASMAAQSGAVPPPPAPAPFTFEAPPHWNRQPPSALRVASFLISGDGVPDADLSVIALPGPAGGNLANVNRWRGQINLPPISESQLAEQATHLHSGPYHIDLYEMVSEAPVLDGGFRARILVAILQEGETTWFFKLVGEDVLVAGEKTDFVTFLMSFQLEDET